MQSLISKRDLALENPPSPYPHGWYRLALSSEVRHDRLLTVRAFGSEIVLFRDRAGKVSALDFDWSMRLDSSRASHSASRAHASLARR
jgi:phenylpropionate dioxygenase-like ring-hydroxylating dioxygenase large terminal subunit